MSEHTFKIDWNGRDGRPRTGDRIRATAKDRAGRTLQLLGTVKAVRYESVEMNGGTKLDWPFEWKPCVDALAVAHGRRPSEHPLWPDFKKWADQYLNPNMMLDLYWSCWLDGAQTIRHIEAETNRDRSSVRADAGPGGPEHPGHASGVSGVEPTPADSGVPAGGGGPAPPVPPEGSRVWEGGHRADPPVDT